MSGPHRATPAPPSSVGIRCLSIDGDGGLEITTSANDDLYIPFDGLLEAITKARMAEQADAADLKSAPSGGAGSSPAPGTTCLWCGQGTLVSDASGLIDTCTNCGAQRTQTCVTSDMKVTSGH